MNVEELLTTRFTKAIKKSYSQPPLIGPKWFHYSGKANPPYFEFTGAGRMAKALASRPDRVAKKLVQNLDLSGLDATVEIKADSKIYVKLNSLPE